MNNDDLWRRLRDAKLVTGDMPPLHDAAAESSCAIRILLGLAGWLAALFLFGFFALAISDLLTNEVGMLTLGTVLCVAAMLLFRLRTTHEFVQQFGLAVALAGHSLLWLGLYDIYDRNRIGAFLSMAALELALVALLPNFLHRVLATIAAGCFGYLALAQLGYPGLGIAFVALLFVVLWLNEARWLHRAALLEPVGIALALLLVILSSGFYQFDWFGSLRHPRAAWGGYITMIVVGAIFLTAVIKLLLQARVPLGSSTGIATLVGALLLALLCARAPGLLPALLVLLVGFARGHRHIWLLGILALLFAGSHYYYSLDYNLLVKSGVLAATGAALLIARALMHRLGGSHA